MRGVTFPAWQSGAESTALIELLLAVGTAVVGRNVSWTMTDCEFASGRRGSDLLAEAAANGRQLTTRELVDLVSDGIQLVDGDVTCRTSSGEPILILRSVRGDEWDVFATDDAVLEAVRLCFCQVSDLPG